MDSEVIKPIYVVSQFKPKPIQAFKVTPVYEFSLKYFKRGFRHGVIKRIAFQAKGTFYRKCIEHLVDKLIVEFNSSADEITVNPSPYAVEVYHHLGFGDTAKEQATDGMRYTENHQTKQ